MTKKEKLENEAYMILQDIAYTFRIVNQGICVVAINLKNISQIATFRIRNNTDLLFSESNMSKENTYKAQLIAERNKVRLIEGAMKWVNTQRIG